MGFFGRKKEQVPPHPRQEPRIVTGSFPRASHQSAPLCTDACCYWFLSMHFLMNQSYLCSIQTSAFFVKGLICRQSYCPLRFR